MSCHRTLLRWVGSTTLAATLVTSSFAQLLSAGSAHEACPPIAQPADPTTLHEYGCYYFATYVWNDGSGAGNVTGRIYWPSDCSSSEPPGVHPLVLLMHGDGQAYTDYGYLMSHLARNGFIAATIQNSGTNLERTAQALTYLGFIRDHWTHRTHVQNSIGLVGHSRGGEAVLTLARRIDELNLSHSIDAIISLAPTDNDEGGAGVHESLDGDESQAYLVIYGTHDEDVLGYCTQGTAPNCGALPSNAQRTGFALFDRAGIEGETEPFPLFDEVVTRCMLFVQGANHNGFRSTCGGFPAIGQLGCDEHQDIARGYMNAFLRWQLRGQTVYRQCFTGQWMPPSIEAQGVTIDTQYVEGYGRRVIDDFQDAALNTDSLGGAFTTGGVLQVLHQGPLWQWDATIPHDTRGVVVAWTPPGFAPWARWSIPDGTTGLGARWRDVRGFDVLSFRAGQIHGSSFNTPGQSKDFWVALRDSAGHTSNSVKVSKFTDLRYPIEANLITLFGQSARTVSSDMSTVRIPLCRFDGVDMANITSVTFTFSVAGSSSGELMLDNLEFSD